MKKLVLVLSVLVSFSSNANNISCESAVDYMVKLINESESEDAGLMKSMLEKLPLIPKFVEKCKKETQTQKGKEKWACVSNAKTYEDMASCDS